MSGHWPTRSLPRADVQDYTLHRVPRLPSRLKRRLLFRLLFADRTSTADRRYNR